MRSLAGYMSTRVRCAVPRVIRLLFTVVFSMEMSGMLMRAASVLHVLRMICCSSRWSVTALSK